MRCFTLAAIVLINAGTLVHAQVDQGLLNLVPAGTRVLAGLRIDQGKVSALGQYMLQQAASNGPQFQQLLDATGFDPRRDLQEVLFASSGPNADGQKQGVVLARGVFDPQRIRNAVVAKNGTITNYQGFDLLSGDHGGDGAVVFLDSTLAALADKPTIQLLIQNRKSPATLNRDLESRMNTVSKGNEAWFASVVPGADLPIHTTQENSMQNRNRAVFQNILQTSGGVHCANDAVNLSFDAATRSDKDAEALIDVVRFIVTMAETQGQDQPQLALLAPSLDAMQTTTNGNAAHVSLSIPEKTVEQLVAQTGPHHHQ